MKELNRSYQELRCYTSLDNSHKKIFDCIVDFYGPKLNQQCFVDTTLFTAHDFNKHCNNIYRIISNIILANANISSKEWLILDLAVLFHDISMSEKLPVLVSRKTHSKGSAEYVMREWRNNNSILKIEISRIDALALNDIYALCGIIQAHSDVIVKFDTNVSSKKFKGLILKIRLDSFVVSFKRINNTSKITNDTKKNSNTD